MTMRVHFSSPWQGHHVNDVVDLDDDEARRLINAGYAQAVDAATPIVSGPRAVIADYSALTDGEILAWNGTTFMAEGVDPATLGGGTGGTGGPETDPVATPALQSHESGADPHGDRAAAATDAASKVTAHAGAADPHGDRADAAGKVTAHAGAADPHGDRAAAATDATGKVNAHAGAADPHGDRAAAATDAQARVDAHKNAADPHGDRGYADTRIAALVNAAPAALDTLAEIDAQLASDETGAAALTASVNQNTTNLAGHIGAAAGAHAASAIAFDDTGLNVVQGADVEAALAAADAALSKPGLTLTTPTPEVINNLTSHLWVEPTDANPAANAITIKRPSSTAAGWGNKNLPYGQGQAFELLSDSAADATVSTDPLNPVLFRIDSFGGIGVCHGAHIATGLREQADAAVPTQSIWVDPSVDAVGLILDNPTPTEVAATPTASFMLIRDVRPATAYTLVEVKADGSLVSNKALVANPRTNTDVPLTVKGLPSGASQANIMEVYDWVGKKRLTVTPNDGSLRGVADDGVTAAFSITPLDAGNAGYRAIFVAINVNTYGVAITSPAAYTKDHFQVVPSGGIKYRVNKAGYEIGKMAAAPALADLSDGEYAFWLDTAGNAFKVSARIGGVLKTGTVAVA